MGTPTHLAVTDQAFMTRALALAARGRGRTSPNPMVGAVVVSPGGVIVGTGFHRAAGEPHAEIHALAAAGAQACGATLYCTLEPCCHVARTGPCVERIVAAGIARVVAAVEDPNPKVSGGGLRYLQAHGVAVTVGPGRAEAVRLNAPFFTVMRHRRPFVIAKVALSLDARMAGPGGARRRLTGAETDRALHRLRAEVDAIAVGSNTVLTDDPRLTARGVRRVRPLTRVVFDTRLRTPPRARLLSTLGAGPVIMVTTEAALADAGTRARALESAGARILPVAARDIRVAVERLVDLEITSVLLEGGRTLHVAGFAADVIDRVLVCVTPHTIGAEGLRWLSTGEVSLAALADVRTTVLGRDVLVDGYVHRID